MYFKWFSGLVVISFFRAPPIDPQIGKEKNTKKCLFAEKKVVKASKYLFKHFKLSIWFTNYLFLMVYWVRCP